MKKTEQSSRSARSILFAIALAGVTAFALMSRPAPSRAVERVEPAASVGSRDAGAQDASPVVAVADSDVCDLQLD